MENYRVHPFMQNKNGYEMILETHPFGTVSRCSTRRLWLTLGCVTSRINVSGWTCRPG
eukprot:SAG25_NODE_496_length_7401_cov_8.698439_14_plen_58_part_00